MLQKATKSKKKSADQEKFVDYVIIPYIKGAFEMTKRILGKKGIRVVSTPQNTIRNYLRPLNPNGVTKINTDRNEMLPSQKNVVYAVPCENCPGIYYGQTKRALETRLKEHAYAVKKEDKNNAIAYHKTQTGHIPNFAETKIIFQEKKLPVRLKFETWAITKPGSEAINFNQKDPVMSRWHEISHLK